MKAEKKRAKAEKKTVKNQIGENIPGFSCVINSRPLR